MAYRQLDNRGERWELPNGDPSNGETVTAKIVRVDASNGPVMDPDSRKQLAGQSTTATGASGEAPGDFALPLWITEGLSPACQLLLVRRGSWGSEAYTVQLPAGDGSPIKWSELVKLGDSVTDPAPSRLDQHAALDSHLSANERDSLSAANKPGGDNPLATLDDMAAGVPGPPGDDGLSAYQVWLAAGNVGTEQDYLAALQGDQGTAGVDGTPGSPGADGNDGAQGLPGPTAVSTDTGNLATLGGDSLLLVAEQAVADAAPVQATDPRLSDARQPQADALFDGYLVETIDVTPSGPGLTLPLDGRPRKLTLTADLDLDITRPAQHTSSLVLWVLQDATGGWSMSFPGTWLWTGGQSNAIDTQPNALTYITIINNPMGTVQIGVMAMGVPA